MAISLPSMGQVVVGSPSYIQVTVTSNTQVLAFDTSRLSWTIHPNGANIRCIPGNTSGQPSSTVPTSTVGYEITGNSYITNYSSYTVSLACTAEAGSVVVDIWADTKNN